MPMSFGLVAGMLVVIAGGLLFATSRRKTVAVVVIGVGAALALGTLAMIVLAVNSRM